jgi:hypothetical protein
MRLAPRPTPHDQGYAEGKANDWPFGQIRLGIRDMWGQQPAFSKVSYMSGVQDRGTVSGDQALGAPLDTACVGKDESLGICTPGFTHLSKIEAERAEAASVAR